MRSNAATGGPAPIAEHGAYWTDGLAPLPATHSDIPSEADVVIIGSGYRACMRLSSASHQTKLHKCLKHKRPVGDSLRATADKLAAASNQHFNSCKKIWRRA